MVPNSIHKNDDMHIITTIITADFNMSLYLHKQNS